MTRQAYGILGKIREVDELMSKDPRLQCTVYEVHPEVSFAVWNGNRPMKHRKSTLAGRVERESLIDGRWPGLRIDLRRQLQRCDYKHDDLNDALVALCTAQRIHEGTAERIPVDALRDRLGLPMQMWA